MAVPLLPGVPSLPSYGPLPALAVNITSLISLFSEDPVWGIFDQENNLLVEPDSVIDLGVRAESKVSDFPIENGQFAAYNKVQEPDLVTVRMTKGGSVDDRDTFLAVIDAAKKSTDLYTIITPEYAYINANIEMYRYAREAQSGANLIVIDIAFKEIRQVEAAYTQASNDEDIKNPASATKVSTGKVQPEEPDESTLSSVFGKTEQRAFKGGGGSFRGGSGASGSWHGGASGEY